MSPNDTFNTSFFTTFGAVVILWSRHRGRPVVTRLILSRPGRPAGRILAACYPRSRAASCALIKDLAHRIQHHVRGNDVSFSLDVIRLDRCSNFQQRVLRAEFAIPRGMVSTYGRIAASLGAPRAARAVGTALATNPFPIIIPCHRAIRSDRSLGGYQGGLRMKRELLIQEGVSFDRNGKVLTEGILA